MNQEKLFPRGMFTGAVLLGILIVWQSNSRQAFLNAQDPEQQGVVAIEVARLTDANSQLRKQLSDLTQQEYKLASAIVDRKSAEESVTKQNEQAEIVAGTSAVSGPGIIININDQLSIPQQIDILNALKNIGAEAISVNNRRVSARFSPWRAQLEAPYEIKAIGSPAALASSLDRRGGVIDQIELTTGALDLNIEQSEKLYLPSATLPTPKYATTVKDENVVNNL